MPQFKRSNLTASVCFLPSVHLNSSYARNVCFDLNRPRSVVETWEGFTCVDSRSVYSQWHTNDTERAKHMLLLLADTEINMKQEKISVCISKSV